MGTRTIGKVGPAAILRANWLRRPTYRSRGICTRNKFGKKFLCYFSRKHAVNNGINGLIKLILYQYYGQCYGSPYGPVKYSMDVTLMDKCIHTYILLWRSWRSISSYCQQMSCSLSFFEDRWTNVLFFYFVSFSSHIHLHRCLEKKIEVGFVSTFSVRNVDDKSRVTNVILFKKRKSFYFMKIEFFLLPFIKKNIE